MRVEDRMCAGVAGDGLRRQAKIALGVSLPAFLAAFGLVIAPAGGLRAEQPDPPVTYNAGMGTAEPARPAPATPAVSGGIDGAGNGEAVTHAHPTPASPAFASPVHPSGQAPVAQAPVSPAPARGGIDAAGNGEAASSAHSTAAASASPAVHPVAPPLAQTAPVPAAPPAGDVAAAPAPLSPLAEAIVAATAEPSGLGLSKKEQEALTEFYAQRAFQPVFVGEAGIGPRGNAALTRFAAAAEDGLDPNDYAVARPAKGADAVALARTETQLAAAALLYARHAQSGRFDPQRISSLVTPVREIPDPAAILGNLATAADVDAALAGYNPPHAGYKALKAQLAHVSGQSSPAIAVIPGGATLKPGARDARVPALRARLGITQAPADETLYDGTLAEAVKAIQDASNIKPTGIIGAATLDTLNKGAGGAPSSARADIIANMERWRWLPRDLGEAYVMVNIPEFTARVFADGKKLHETRVIVGKPDTPTPLLSRDMQYVVVNPAWNIPPSIARNEMMPLLQSDPSALARRGIQVVRNGSGGYSFRQAPGERNALGRIKFMFPNDHSVYLHDTPSRGLFANDRRAYSHGCVRVNEPLKFGEVIFGLGMPGDSWSQARISKMLGGSERYVNLKQRFPVHIVYFNVLVNDSGRLVVREDLYGINAQTKALLGLDGRRRIAEGERPARR